MVRSNCSGLEVVKSAIENIYDDLEDNEIILTNSKGETLSCGDMDEDSSFLEKMLIKAEIVSLEELAWEKM